jgi:uncharacterized membrane protein YgcG
MTDPLFDALEVCLQNLERGQTLDSALTLYPDLESELRPILEVSLQARTLAVSSIPDQVQRRARARLLQRAAELRASKRSSVRRKLAFLPRMVLAFGLTAAFILSSTGLVSASSNSLPGDQLYPVKRTWEGVQLAFVLNEQTRETLQSQFEQERLNEIDELLVQNRSQSVSFSGLVLQRQDGKWLVSGVQVLVNDKTHLPASQISDSVPVMVIGVTNSNGVLNAQEIQVLQPGSMLPPLEPSDNGENPRAVSTVPSVQIPASAVTSTPAAPSATPQSFSFTGILQKMNGMIWTINGQMVSMDQARINGTFQIGSVVRFEGYYSNGGSFVVTSIENELPVTPSHSNGNNNSNNGHGDNGGDDNGGGEHGGGGGGD